MEKPAKQMTGRTLDGGWKVVKEFDRLVQATGGLFSIGYLVEHESGKKAFLKALDYSGALSSTDPARALQAMTEAYNFERDLLYQCKGYRLDHIVMSLDDGSVPIDLSNPFTVVQYIIFELADGDVRAQLDAMVQLDIAWCLRSLHHLAVGLWQLHGHGMAHQDVKPSNVLVFEQEISKLSDLGRACSRSLPSPHDEVKIAGDYSYAPPELLYGYVSSDWNERRCGCDAYLLGSMVVFFFARVSMTGLLLSKVHESHHWKTWGGSFDEVLPYLREAFGRSITEFEQSVPFELRSEISTAIRQLCDPDPRLRGNPLTRAGVGNNYSIERYVSLFDLLARKAEAHLFRKGL